MERKVYERTAVMFRSSLGGTKMDRMRNVSIRGTWTSWTKDGGGDDHQRRLMDLQRVVKVDARRP